MLQKIRIFCKTDLFNLTMAVVPKIPCFWNIKQPTKSETTIYRVSIKSFPDYKHLLQENYVEYKRIFFFCILSSG